MTVTETPDALLQDPAIVFKPLPHGEGDRSAGTVLGGLPRLPESLDWPRNARGEPLHFLFQIRLDDLPYGFRIKGQAFHMPEMPRHGTLFLFLGLMCGAQSVRVLYSAEDASALPETAPPQDLPDLRKSDPPCVDFNALSPCGRHLKRQAVETLLILSEPPKFHDERYAWRSDTETVRRPLEAVLEERPEPWQRYSFPWLKHLYNPRHDILRRSNEQPAEGLLGRLSGLFSKTPGGAVDRAEELDGQRDYDVPPGFPWRWSVVREVAGRVKMQVALDLGIENHQIGQHICCDFIEGDAPALLHLWRDAAAAADRWLVQCPDADGPVPEAEAEAFRGWLEALASAGHVQPRVQAPDPEVVAAAEPHLQVLRSEKPALWTYPEMTKSKACLAVEALIPLMACVDTEDDGLPVPYYNAWDAERRPTQKLHEILEDAMHNFTRRLWQEERGGVIPDALFDMEDERIRQETAVRPDLIQGNARTVGHTPSALQMFGFGENCQGAPQRHADKLMLLQLPEGFGLPYVWHDGVVQLWIAPEALAEGRFDEVVLTYEAS